MPISESLKDAILNSLKNPVVFVNREHIVCYMNRAAINHYSEGEALLGTSILDCHNTTSQKMILEIWQEMQNGLEERLITDNHKHRIYMRAVRDKGGTVLGYYERYEPPTNSTAQ